MKLPSGLMLKREQVIERVAGMYANRYGDIGEGGGGDSCTGQRPL